MPLYGANGAPFPDFDNDSPRDDLIPAWQEMTDWADRRSVGSFTTEAARNAAMAGLGPADRRLAIVASINALTMWTGSKWVTVAQVDGGAWQTWTPKMLNWNTSTGEKTELNPGGFAYSGRWTMLGPKTCAWKMAIDFGNPGGLGEQVFAFTLPFHPGPGMHLGDAKVAHAGSTFGASCQSIGGGHFVINRGDGTGGGFYHRRTWGTGSTNDWARGDTIVAQGVWETA